MKIKDIVVREDDGTGALTTKPLPGAQQIIAPDGKPIGTADQATADAMKAAAEKGTLTLGGDEQQTSEEQDGEEDLVRHGNRDVGGDGTDQFIHDIKMYDSTVDQSNIDVMRSAITSALTSSDLTPEEKAAAQTLIVKDADGDVDADKTLIACVKSIPAAFEELVTAFGKIVEVGEAYISGAHSYEPTFATLSPEDQAKYKQDIADLKEQLSKTSQQLQQQKPELDKSMGDLQNTLSQASPQKPASESKRDDDELLEKMRMIAGLR
jgi:hypothetical protein